MQCPQGPPRIGVGVCIVGPHDARRMYECNRREFSQRSLGLGDSFRLGKIGQDHAAKRKRSLRRIVTIKPDDPPAIRQKPPCHRQPDARGHAADHGNGAMGAHPNTGPDKESGALGKICPDMPNPLLAFPLEWQ